MYRRRKNSVSHGFTYVFNLGAAVTGTKSDVLRCNEFLFICRDDVIHMPFRGGFDLGFPTVSCIRLRGDRYLGSVYVRAAPVGAYNKWTDANISRMFTLSCTRGPPDFSGTYDSLIYHRSPTPTQMCICCAPIILTNLGCHHVLLLYFIQSRSSRLFSSRWRWFST